ncbi:putative basic proline-rich protein-like [Iris pallida]|uniref:Basic proline-rich protein-like n=1 Tax=Iris pallida TaxID=29817 RepID=A0AAX6DV86_IRIPA|nr:putative basic proline-rich protein-like [Iris pallida]
MKKQVGAGAPLLASPPSPPVGAWFGWPAGLLGSAGPPILLLPIGGSPLSTIFPGWPPTAWLPPLWPLPPFAGLPPPWGASFSASGLLPSPLPLSPRRRPRRPRRRRARRWPPPAPAARPGVLGPLLESSPARSPPSGPSPPRPDPPPSPSRGGAIPRRASCFGHRLLPAVAHAGCVLPPPPGLQRVPRPSPLPPPSGPLEAPSSSTAAWVHSLELGMVASPQPPSGRVPTSGRAVPPSPAVAALSPPRGARSGLRRSLRRSRPPSLSSPFPVSSSGGGRVSPTAGHPSVTVAPDLPFRRVRVPPTSPCWQGSSPSCEPAPAPWSVSPPPPGGKLPNPLPWRWPLPLSAAPPLVSGFFPRSAALPPASPPRRPQPTATFAGRPALGRRSSGSPLPGLCSPSLPPRSLPVGNRLLRRPQAPHPFRRLKGSPTRSAASCRPPSLGRRVAPRATRHPRAVRCPFVQRAYLVPARTPGSAPIWQPA